MGLKLAIERAVLGGGEEMTSIITGPARGIRMRLNRSEETKVWVGVYELWLQHTLLRLARPDMVAWDIGANNGFLSLLLARVSRQVYAFEPHPEAVEALRVNIALNRLPVTPVEVAITDGSAPEVELLLGEVSRTSRVASSPYMKNRPVGTAVVPARSMDDLAGELGQPGLVKIDVEGAEVEVLRGGREVLASGAVIICEVHGTNAVIVSSQLVELGYEVKSHGKFLVATR
jgi:FkbM family methyltransferase